jgi:hypothetical protein
VAKLVVFGTYRYGQRPFITYHMFLFDYKYSPPLDVFPFVREAIYSRDWVFHHLITDGTEVFCRNLERWTAKVRWFCLWDFRHMAWSPSVYPGQLPSIFSPIDQESS